MSTTPIKSTLDVFKPDLFRGKVLFATGGGSGICYGQVEAVMRHGADAVIVGRRQEVISKAATVLSKTTGRKCIGVSADVRKVETLKAAVDKAISEFGHIDFVICAAAGNFLSPIEGTSENGFKSVIDIDLLGTYNTIKATLSHIKKSRGTYIHVSATLHYTGLPLQAHSSAAKAGVDALSRVLGVEGGPFGVRSVVIAPGPIADTEGTKRLVIGDVSEATKPIPAQRFGVIEDIAAATVFLFSPAASYITATEIVVDGGAWHLGSIGPGIQFYPEMLDPSVAAGFRESKA